MRQGRLGVYGGMFDPPHLGHLAAVRAALQVVDSMVIVVAGTPPHRESGLATPHQRLQLATAAFDGLPGVTMCDLEVRFAAEYPRHSTFMVNTLEALGVVHAHRRLALLIGDDQAATFQQWHEPRAILQLADVLVVPRHDSNDSGLQSLIEFAGAEAHIEPVPMPLAHVSSSELRRLIAAGDFEAVHQLVPEAVAAQLQGIYLALSPGKLG